MKRLESICQLPGFDWAHADITDELCITQIFAQENFDAVVNLAARAGVRQSAYEPIQFYESNVIGTINLLEQCRQAGINRFVLASSSSVYGDREGTFTESSRTDAPISPYAASKKAAEDVCQTYQHLYGINAGMLRFFSVYGPAGRPDMSIFRFVRAIVEGEPLTVFGDGQQSRDFTYIDDIASGVVAAVEKAEGSKMVNLGSGDPATLCDLISEIESAAQRRATIRHTEADPLDVRATWADISRAKQLFNWSPRVDLTTGIQRTVDWYLENRSWARAIHT